MTTPETTKQDALGNPVVFGNKYGYSTDCSGWTQSVVGIAKKETAKYITLEVLEARRAVYSNNPELVQLDKRYVNVKAMKLFPLGDSDG